MDLDERPRIRAFVTGAMEMGIGFVARFDFHVVCFNASERRHMDWHGPLRGSGRPAIRNQLSRL
jgi:hypothetical protein